MIIIGICAMAKKVTGQPMHELLERLRSFGDLKLVVFNESVILHDPIDKWPRVQALIAFYSHGFPLKKAIAYSEIEPKPYLINDLKLQYLLMDRRQVYRVLKENGVRIPEYLVLNRNNDGKTAQRLKEFHDRIVIDGRVMFKPFVEKPVSGDDHNIYVYYPDGGCRRLFRKVENRSSEYSPNKHVRHKGSYIYEEFVETGRDIKVFAVGSVYAHIESRKSPTVDGIVERNRFGRERRQTERLSSEERAVASIVTQCFKQTVCGLDILRNHDLSYVIDVNGWSFVKGNSLYYDQCARILRAMCRSIHQNQLERRCLLNNPFLEPERKLIGLVCVFRHADRSPKQKIKFVTNDESLLRLVPLGKFKGVSQKAALLTAVSTILESTESQDEKYIACLHNLVAVLTNHMAEANVTAGYLTEEQSSALFVCKWGGEITEAGIEQSKNLANDVLHFIHEEAGEAHSDHQFIARAKVFSSTIDRVTKSAEYFSKTFSEEAIVLNTFDDDHPIIQPFKSSKIAIEESKQSLHDMLLNYTRGPIKTSCGPYRSIAPSTYLHIIDNPLERLTSLRKSMDYLIRFLGDAQIQTPNATLYHNEPLPLFYRRWLKMRKYFRFFDSDDWDVTKIPDIYDSAIYDMLHNANLLPGLAKFLAPVLQVARILSDFVVPQEYGVTVHDKRKITGSLGRPLLQRIIVDCESIASKSSPENCIFYFLHESHMHLLRNSLVWSGLAENECVADNLELMPLAYCSHFIVKLYESGTNGEARHEVAVEFSPGAVEYPDIVMTPHIQAVSVPAPFCGNVALEQFCSSMTFASTYQ